jgi:hypothetical protein
MNKQWPLQTSNNCLAFAYWVAMREALKIADEFRELPFTPEDITRYVRIPAMSDDLDVRISLHSMAYGAFYFYVNRDALPVRKLPQVAATWDAGFSHAVCLLPNSGKDCGYCYDSALGDTRNADFDKLSRCVTVSCENSTKLPYRKWYYKYGIARKLAIRFNWI